jgi:hypothetical protein
MTDPLDAALAPLADHIRGISDLPARFAEVEEAERRVLVLKRALLQEVAIGLRAEGKKWKEIGSIMGSVSYQRAFQIGRGE